MGFWQRALLDTEVFRVEVGHAVGVLASAALGAVVAYVMAIPPGGLMEALSTWESAKKLLLGALVAALIAATGQAQKSFIKAAAVLFLLGGLALGPAACGGLTATEKQAISAFGSDALCVENQIVNQGQMSTIALISACGSNIPQEILALVESFFESPKAAALPATQVAALKASMKIARAQFPPPAGAQ